MGLELFGHWDGRVEVGFWWGLRGLGERGLGMMRV